MSKQRPNPDKMANELSGASAFFRSATPPPAQPAPSVSEPSLDSVMTTPVPAPSHDVMTSKRQSVTTSASPLSAASAGFDINRPTASRDSLRLSVDETRALDELRASLKWDYDLTVSKNDICRAALHWLLEDFRVKGEKSTAVARLRRKQTSR